MHYLVYVCGAMLMWGVWGFMPRLVAARLDFVTATVWTFLGSALVALPCMALLGGRPESGGRAWLFGLVAGACGTIGGLFYNNAMSRCGVHTSSVIVISALYPAVSVILALLVLRERPNAGQVAGILLCGAGAVLLAYSSGRPTD